MCFSPEAKVLQVYGKMPTVRVMARIYFRYSKFETSQWALYTYIFPRILSSRKIFLDSTRNSYVNAGHSPASSEDFFALQSDILLQTFRIAWSTLLNCQIIYRRILGYNILCQSKSQIGTYEVRPTILWSMIAWLI